jgi:putative glutamine amidotransferase
MRAVIGITTYNRDKENQFLLPAEYVDSISRAGGIPLLIPHAGVDAEELLTRCDGLMLSGGGDLDPASYGGNPHETNDMVDGERDRAELALTRKAVESGFPILAICRGAQVLNVALGGKLIEHVPDEVGEAVAHRLSPKEGTPHRVTIEADSRLARILGCTECTPVSWHHQAIRVPGQGLRVVARAPDGIVEAVEMPQHPWLVAVQWHPELSAAEDPVQQRLFDQFVKGITGGG